MSTRKFMCKIKSYSAQSTNMMTQNLLKSLSKNKFSNGR